MPRHGVQYVENDEPSFIKNFKAKVGYKEGPNVNSKCQIPNFSDDDEDDNLVEKEDEKPTVVVLKDGDMTAEEADSAQKEIDDGPARLDEKITFKKPVKRNKEETQEEDKESSSSSSEPKKKKKDSKSKDGKNREKQKALLSFADEDEEET